MFKLITLSILLLVNCFQVHLLVTNRTIPALIDIALPYLKIGRIQVFRGQKCFPQLGCFNASEVWHPIHRPLSLAPEDPEAIRTKFYLFSHKDQLEPQLINMDNFTESEFDPRARVVITIHGFYYDNFFGQYQKESFLKLRNSLFAAGKINYIFTDWGRGASTWYLQATANTRVVGAQIALLVRKLMSTYKLSPSQFHIIGHSLGAHVAGYAGAKIKNIGRITGLDPAKPYFDGMPTEFRLDKGDANFVDVIHTNSPHRFHPFGFGTYKSVGHLDFYPNGGNAQPGCRQDKLSAFMDNGIENGIQRAGICNHERSILFLAEALTNRQCPMFAFKCESFDQFKAGECFLCGENGQDCKLLGQKPVSKDEKDKRFFLLTNSQPPYCVHHYRILLQIGQFAEDHENLEGQIMVTYSGDTNSIATGDSGNILLTQQKSVSFLAIGDKVSSPRALSLKWTPRAINVSLLIISFEATPMNLWDDQMKVSRSTRAFFSLVLEPSIESTVKL